MSFTFVSSFSRSMYSKQRERNQVLVSSVVSCFWLPIDLNCKHDTQILHYLGAKCQQEL